MISSSSSSAYRRDGETVLEALDRVLHFGLFVAQRQRVP